MNHAKKLLNKLKQHSLTNCSEIKTDIDDLIKLSEETVKQLKDTEDEIYEVAPVASVFIRPGCKLHDELVSHGLLGERLVESFGEIVTHQNTNQLHFLEHLQTFEHSGFKRVQTKPEHGKKELA